MNTKVKKELINFMDVKKILDIANEKGADIEEYEGTLNDNYIICDAEHMHIGKKTTNFIIILAEYLSHWENNLYIIRTNDSRVVDHYRSIFEN